LISFIAQSTEQDGSCLITAVTPHRLLNIAKNSYQPTVSKTQTADLNRPLNQRYAELAIITTAPLLSVITQRKLANKLVQEYRDLATGRFSKQ